MWADVSKEIPYLLWNQKSEGVEGGPEPDPFGSGLGLEGLPQLPLWTLTLLASSTCSKPVPFPSSVGKGAWHLPAHCACPAGPWSAFQGLSDPL